MDNIALVIGANGGISQAIIKQLTEDGSISKVIAISRSPTPINDKETPQNITWMQSDYSQQSIQDCIRSLEIYKRKISRVFITNGILQTDTVRPERSLKELTIDNLHDVFHVNTVIPSLWLAALAPLLSFQDKSQACVVSILSARVGSIQDNELGGWHSYRASKAALNMILKGASIEFVRNRKIYA